MAVRIQVRRDTAANWTAANPILSDGEIGLEKDTLKTKYGDGVTEWNSLSYASSNPDLSNTQSLITISGLKFILQKHPNNSAATLEVDDVISGFEPLGNYIMAKYLGGDETDFLNDSIYNIFNGI